MDVKIRASIDEPTLFCLLLITLLYQPYKRQDDDVSKSNVTKTSQQP